MKKYKRYLGFFLMVISVFIYVVKDKELEVKDTVVTSTITTMKYFYVDVKGAVNNPGVYLVHEGQIVMDAILMAGGFTSDYDASNLNLAEKLTSSMVINVLKKGEVKDNLNNAPSGKININTANLEVLDSLPGISTKVAQNIIDYRKNQKFMRIEDIMNVSGIKNATFEKIKDFITV